MITPAVVFGQADAALLETSSTVLFRQVTLPKSTARALAVRITPGQSDLSTNILTDEASSASLYLFEPSSNPMVEDCPSAKTGRISTTTKNIRKTKQLNFMTLGFNRNRSQRLTRPTGEFDTSSMVQYAGSRM